MVAAMPHVLLITVFIGSWINKESGWGDESQSGNVGKIYNESLKRVDNSLEQVAKKIEKANESASIREYESSNSDTETKVIQTKELESVENDLLKSKYFSTFEEATVWARENPGCAFTRTSNGRHFTPILDQPFIPQLPAKTSQRDLVDLLVNKYGFEFYVPSHPMWRGVLTYTNDSESLYFLIRKLGITVKFYGKEHQYSFDSKGCLRAVGGKVIGDRVSVQLSYKYSDSVHKRVNEIAYLFSNNKELSQAHYLDTHKVSPEALASPPPARIGVVTNQTIKLTEQQRHYIDEEKEYLELQLDTRPTDAYDMSEIYDN